MRRIGQFVMAVGLIAAVVYAGRYVQELYAEPPPQDLTPAAYPPPASAPRIAPGNRLRVAQGWIEQTAAATGIPQPAVRAYATAELTAPSGCELGWTTLAGIGWVESQHGTLGGRILQEDGHSDSRILGPALNGRNGFKAIPASAESTTFHGDPKWDHAVGPMQFIPSTWDLYGADGEGDGASDPNDLDDSAYAAADYLCSGQDTTTAQGWSSAVLSYNQSAAYLADVHAAATLYADRAP